MGNSSEKDPYIIFTDVMTFMSWKHSQMPHYAGGKYSRYSM